MDPRRPHIILVVLDSARRDRFGCYGYPRPTTPTVDALARAGLLAETIIANGPWTKPAHGSLFTGLYPSQHGCQSRNSALRPSVATTLAEWLAGLGYETWCVTNNGLISPRTSLARGFARYVYRPDLQRGWQRAVRRMGKPFGGDGGGGVVNTWLRRELPPPRRPLCLFVNYLECHWPYLPPRRFERRVAAGRTTLVEGLRYRVLVGGRLGAWEAVARAGPEDLRIMSDFYDGALAQADHHLATLLDILQRRGYLHQPAIVIVTSDHGEHLGERGLADHLGALDDALIRVPFVVWAPGIIPQGRAGDAFEFVDVLPSLAHLLGQPLPAPYLAARRTHLFSGTDRGGDDFALAEWRGLPAGQERRLARRNPSFDFTRFTRDLICARTRRFKLVVGSDRSEALYDLEADPLETTDVAAVHPADVTALRARLEAAQAEWATWETDPPVLSPEDEREIERRLADLGYM